MKINRRKFIAILGLATTSVIAEGHFPARAVSKMPEGETPGRPLPPWKAGELDFHIISTGRGEQAFVIMPDGTSMLIDAGDYNNPEGMMAAPVPDTFLRPGEYIANYVKAVNPNGENVDYLMVSHFHNDHTGDTTRPGLPVVKGPLSEYICCGIMEAGQQLKFAKVFDRGYPDYNYPLLVNDPDVDNQRKFYANKHAEYGLQQEKFDVGRLNQIKMVHGGAAPAKFAIQNIAANGEVWTGKDMATRKLYDLDPRNPGFGENENIKSLVIRIDYGPFSLYTGGDFNGNLYSGDGDRTLAVEDEAAEAIGPVDVAKTNHHCCGGTFPPKFLKTLDARHYLIGCWDYWHLNPEVMDRVYRLGRYNGEPQVFTTYRYYTYDKNFGDCEWMRDLAPEFGHIVVRVAPGGKTYDIYVLSDRDESRRIIAHYGPFKSGKHQKLENNEVNQL